MSKNVALMNLQKMSAVYKFAAEKHFGQTRKNAAATPYISHPTHVGFLLQYAGVTDLDIIAAGILHDTLEDTPTTHAELVANFGSITADIVAECTDNKSLPKITRKKLQIEYAATISTGAKLVKLADKYSNLSDLLEDPPAAWSREQICGYFNWGYAVVKQMHNHNDVFDAMFAELWSKYETQFNTRLCCDETALCAYYDIIKNKN